MISTEKTIEYIEKEYELAKNEYKFYAEQFNKQENLYSLFFSVASILLGLLFIINPDSNDILTQIISFLSRYRYIPAGMILYITVTYAYFFTVMMGNSYYLVLYSEKIVVLEKIINHYADKDILIWERKIMSDVQSTNNTIKGRYINVNILKIVFVAIQYICIQLILGTAFSLVVKPDISPWYCAVIALLIPLFLLWQFYVIWHDLPGMYRKEFRDIYEKQLGIKLKEDKNQIKTNKRNPFVFSPFLTSLKNRKCHLQKTSQNKES